MAACGQRPHCSFDLAEFQSRSLDLVAGPATLQKRGDVIQVVVGTRISRGSERAASALLQFD
jgi:hypothetical protein